MLAKATVTVDLAKVTENTHRVVEALGGRGVYGVTKVTCGAPEVAHAMLAGGAAGIADSRLENVARMREAGVAAGFWSLRAPALARAEEAVRLIDVSLERVFRVSAVKPTYRLALLTALAGATPFVTSGFDKFLLAEAPRLPFGQVRVDLASAISEEDYPVRLHLSVGGDL